MAKEYSVAVAGATGAVGTEMIATLERRGFPVARLVPLASARSRGRKVSFRGEEIPVEVLKEDSFKGLDIALFSAGAGASRDFAPRSADAGCIVVDNSSAWRMDPEVPLVVPEVNRHAVAHYKNRGIIANPNCSTIQMVVVLKPIHDAAKIRRVVVATYQAVSGTGLEAIEELRVQSGEVLGGGEPEARVYPHPIAFNLLPHIGAFRESGYTEEELKMVFETRKIMEDDSLRVTATTVRVPVYYGHSESVNVETEKKLTAAEAREILASAPGVEVADDPAANLYPMPITAAHKDETFVGRIREDMSVEKGLEMFIVADNIRKGAALNTVQIAEALIGDFL